MGPGEREGLLAIKLENLRLASRLVIEALTEVEAGRELERQAQDESRAAYYPSPGLREFVRVAGISKAPRHRTWC